MYRKVSYIFSLFTVASIIAGCSMFGDEEKSPAPNQQVKRVESKASAIDKGILNTWFGLNGEPGSGGASSGAGISVNGFLWRAALDTISFMPLAQADPFGGIILTDWYLPPETENERFKVNVYILDSELRADGLRVSVFRQRINVNGTWVNATVSADTGTSLENAILKRARQMRVTRQ